MPSSIYISAAHKSSGKTVVSLGLCAALKQQPLKVQSFKKGPDYIDPIWLSQASGNPCYNLDFYNMTNNEILQLYAQYSSSSDISIIEGNKGLFDGVNVTGGDANADLAKLLDIPVLLVVDASGITRGVAPLVSGYQAFDKDLNIAGVILNKVAGDRHESKLIQAIEHYTDIPVMGSIRRSKDLIIDERHLGLVPANETPESKTFIDIAARQISDQVDLNKIIGINQHSAKQTKLSPGVKDNNLSVAIAKDSAFGFYYQDDLDKFIQLGVEIKYFNALEDDSLPDVDALFIGGGFPEMKLKELSVNKSLLADVKAKIESGMPSYAECGGLMYLSNSITQSDNTYSMAGVIDADAVMNKKPIGRGYVQLEPTEKHPWNNVSNCIYAHEFHYSKLENLDSNTQYVFKVLRGVGVDNMQDGILIHNLVATYTHLRNVAGNQWVEQFVDFIKTTKDKSS